MVLSWMLCSRFIGVMLYCWWYSVLSVCMFMLVVLVRLVSVSGVYRWLWM